MIVHGSLKQTSVTFALFAALENLLHSPKNIIRLRQWIDTLWSPGVQVVTILLESLDHVLPAIFLDHPVRKSVRHSLIFGIRCNKKMRWIK